MEQGFTMRFPINGCLLVPSGGGGLWFDYLDRIDFHFFVVSVFLFSFKLLISKRMADGKMVGNGEQGWASKPLDVTVPVIKLFHEFCGNLFRWF